LPDQSLILFAIQVETPKGRQANNNNFKSFSGLSVLDTVTGLYLLEDPKPILSVLETGTLWPLLYSLARLKTPQGNMLCKATSQGLHY
jgi:hypothetical protein